jgi:hypothetical protein
MMELGYRLLITQEGMFIMDKMESLMVELLLEEITQE